MNRNRSTVYTITYTAVMAAIIYVITTIRIPLGESRIHVANVFCLLGSLLLDPVSGGIAAGFGSALYDAFIGGYDVINVLITFVSKFLMAYICGVIYHGVSGRKREHSEKKIDHKRVILACIAGSLSYVALYMLKTWIFQMYVYHYEPSVVWVTMLAKFGPSMLNAVAAIILTPLLFQPLYKALNATME